MKTRNYFTLLILAGIFVCPGVTAYWVYNHPQWLSAKPTNKGQLLSPPTPLPVTAERKKWQLILWYPTTCHSECRQQIDKLSRIRLALGRRLYEVDETVLTRDNFSISHQLIEQLQEQNVTIKQIKSDYFPGYPQVYLSSPENYLILQYGLAADSADIFNDLKHVLTSVTQKKQG